MSDKDLSERVKKIVEDFDSSNVKDIVDVLEKIMPYFKTNDTKDYLSGKIQGISNADEQKKRELCNKLKPYFDWYIQGAIGKEE